MYELLFPSQQPKPKHFRRRCLNLMFPHILQQLTNKMEEDHQLTITVHGNEIRAIQYENVVLQAQIDVHHAQLQRCEDTITHLRAFYVGFAGDPGKDDIIINMRKHTISTNDRYHDLPDYVSRIQRRKSYVKLRWLNQQFPGHEVIVEIDSPNSIQAFNRY